MVGATLLHGKCWGGTEIGVEFVRSELNIIRKYVDAEINKIEDADKRSSAIAHLYGVSLAATMLAKKRGLDPEIASMAAMLHVLHAYKHLVGHIVIERPRDVQFLSTVKS